MNILITGANGLLGRNMVELLSITHNVYAVVKSNEEIKFKENKKTFIIELDLAEPDLTLIPHNIDVVYYLAQSNRFREFPAGATDMCNLNIITPLKLCEWGVENKVKKFIYASSGGVYSNPDKPVKEFFDINANEKHGFYLDSKLSAEMLLKNYANLFETFTIIRPFFMYGFGQNNTMLIPRLVDNVINNKEIVLSGNEGIKINQIYVSDAAQAVVKILNLKGEHIINIAGNDIISLKKLCVIIGEVVDKNPIFKINNNIQSDLIADINVMKDELFCPQVDIKSGLIRLIGKYNNE